MEYIKPGHYCSEATLNTETKEIIRVLGRDPSNPNYVITGDGKKIPEYTLLNGFVLLDTLATEADVNKSKSDIFRGLDTVISKHASLTYVDESPDVSYADAQYIVDSKTADFRDYAVREYNDKMISVSVSEQSPIIDNPKPENKIRELIERAKIDVLNVKEMRRHGVATYKKQIITLPIEFQIEYDIKKLQQLIELFDIEPRDVVSEIISDIEIPHAILEKMVFDMLLSTNQQESINTRETVAITEPTNIQQPVESITEQSEIIQSNQKTITDTISEIDSVLSKLSSNRSKS